MSAYKKVLVGRLRDAYALNQIPWDESLADMREDKIRDTAEYWERKVETDEPDPLFKHQWPNPNASLPILADLQYHGSGYTC